METKRAISSVALFNAIVDRLKKENRWPEDMIDYALASDWRAFEIENEQFDIIGSADYGGSEGVYLDVRIDEYDKNRMFGTVKTLQEGIEPLRRFAVLGADFKHYGYMVARDMFQRIDKVIEVESQEKTLRWNDHIVIDRWEANGRRHLIGISDDYTKTSAWIYDPETEEMLEKTYDVFPTREDVESLYAEDPYPEIDPEKLVEIKGFACSREDEWEDESYHFIIGSLEDSDGTWHYAEIRDKVKNSLVASFEYDPESEADRAAVESDLTDFLADRDLDRYEAEFGADGTRAFRSTDSDWPYDPFGPDPDGKTDSPAAHDTLFSDYLELEENNGKAAEYIISDLREAGATDQQLEALGFGWYLETEKEQTVSLLNETDPLAIAEILGWNVSVEESFDGGYCYTFQQYSPAGEDFSFDVFGHSEDIKDSVREYAAEFDENEHVELWIDARGKNGVPESVKDLVEDASAIKKMLTELADALDAVAPLDRIELDPADQKSCAEPRRDPAEEYTAENHEHDEQIAKNHQIEI